ncbi:MAG: hypothetical protein ACI8WT_001725 [Clostridium sp.]|jgi:hypothetical protein
MQVVEIYPYKSFKEKLRLYDKLRKSNNCKIEAFEGFFFIEKFNLVHAEFDFKKHKSVKKRKRRQRRNDRQR